MAHLILIRERVKEGDNKMSKVVVKTILVIRV